MQKEKKNHLSNNTCEHSVIALVVQQQKKNCFGLFFISTFFSLLFSFCLYHHFHSKYSVATICSLLSGPTFRNDFFRCFYSLSIYSYISYTNYSEFFFCTQQAHYILFHFHEEFFTCKIQQTEEICQIFIIIIIIFQHRCN